MVTAVVLQGGGALGAYALERAAGGDPGVARELIVVEVFGMRGPVPRNLPEVLDRTAALQHTSRLTLDADFFDTISGSSTWSTGWTRRCRRTARCATTPPGSGCAHRRIDHLNVVTSRLPPELSRAGDFSRRSVEARIRAGHDDAVAQGIGSPRSPGLRRGVTGPAPAP